MSTHSIVCLKLKHAMPLAIPGHVVISIGALVFGFRFTRLSSRKRDSARICVCETVVTCAALIV